MALRVNSRDERRSRLSVVEFQQSRHNGPAASFIEEHRPLTTDSEAV